MDHKLLDTIQVANLSNQKQEIFGQNLPSFGCNILSFVRLKSGHICEQPFENVSPRALKSSESVSKVFSR